MDTPLTASSPEEVVVRARRGQLQGLLLELLTGLRVRVLAVGRVHHLRMALQVLIGEWVRAPRRGLLTIRIINVNAQYLVLHCVHFEMDSVRAKEWP